MSCGGFEVVSYAQLTPDNVTDENTTAPGGASGCNISAAGSSVDVIVTLDGTLPSPTNGFHLKAGNAHPLDRAGYAVQEVRALATAAGPGTVDVEWVR